MCLLKLLSVFTKFKAEGKKSVILTQSTAIDTRGAKQGELQTRTQTGAVRHFTLSSYIEAMNHTLFGEDCIQKLS